jgi:hypothetical protein
MLGIQVLAAVAVLLGSLLSGPKGDSAVPPPPRPPSVVDSGSGVN